MRQRQQRCERSYLEELETNFHPRAGTEFIFSMFWTMYDVFGPQYWWPGQTPFEIATGAILTQNAAWKNVEKAISNLKKHKCLSPQRILEMPDHKLALLLRPAGYYNIKTERLKNFVKVLMEDFDGKMEQMAQEDDEEVRKTLLKIKGIGPETADSIILYALGKPSFVVDAYTFRILERHDIIDSSWDYAMLRDYFMANLPLDVCLFNEFHALFVRAGKDFCKSRRPACDSCPMNRL